MAHEPNKPGWREYKWKQGGRRVFLGSPPLQEIWASPRKKQKKQMVFKMDRLLYRPSRLPVFRTGRPCARGSPRHSPAYYPFEKKETPPSYGYSSVTFFDLASTKLEDAVLDADSHIKLSFRRYGMHTNIQKNKSSVCLCISMIHHTITNTKL